MTGTTLIDLKKGELTLRVRDEEVHFNLNHSLKQSELSIADCEIVETKIPVSYELPTACNFQNLMNENEMNFHYLEHSEVEIMNFNFKLKDSVFSVREISAERSSSYCKTRENSNFRKKGKIVISVKIRNFSRSRITKRISLLESSCGI